MSDQFDGNAQLCIARVIVFMFATMTVLTSDKRFNRQGPQKKAAVDGTVNEAVG